MQYNSKNIDVVAKMKLDKLVNKLVNSNSGMKRNYKNLEEAIDNPIDKKIKTFDNKSKYGKAMISSCESLRSKKHNEIYSHIANQVLKLVKNNDWKANVKSKGNCNDQ